MEQPDRRKFEVCFIAGAPRESQLPRDPGVGRLGCLRSARPDDFCRAERFRKEQFDQAGRVRGSPELAGTGCNCEAHQTGNAATGRTLGGERGASPDRGVHSKRGKLCHPNHPRRRLDELCDRGGAGTVVLHPALLHMPGQPRKEHPASARACRSGRARRPRRGCAPPIHAQSYKRRLRFAVSASGTRLFDNSGAEPRPVFEMRGGRVVGLNDEIPVWAAALLERNTNQRE